MVNFIALKDAGQHSWRRVKKRKNEAPDKKRKKAASKDKPWSPRIYKQLPLKVAANGYDFISTAQNVSCVGAYCRINKYIPPFTRVMIKLTLPLSLKKKDKGSKVECKGVVVRSGDENEGGFNIAIFFNDIKDNERKKISQYISKVLLQHSLPKSPR